MHIAIKINATGDSCKGCKLFDELKCLFLPVDDWFDFNRWNKDGERLPECIAAEIPVQCASCNNYGQEECTNCFSRKNEDWIPPTVGNQ